MIISLQKTETATATHDVELDHACGACKKTSPAWVRGKASVTESRSAFEMGSSDAQFLAETEAQRNAALLIRIARCPHCGVRDPSEMRKLWVHFAWGVIGAELLHLSFSALSNDDFARAWAKTLVSYVLLAIAACVGAAIKIWRDLHASDARVRFIKEQVSEQQGPYRSAS